MKEQICLLHPSILQLRATAALAYALVQTAKVDTLVVSILSSFEEWRFLISTNHSILFFGAGSKRNLLNQLCEQELDTEGYALAIDGYDSHVTVEALLDLLVALFLNGKEPIPMASMIAMKDGDDQRGGISNPWKAHELVERAITVSRALAQEASISLVPIFLVIHNLDGESFRNTLAQESLAALLVNSNVANGVASIRLVASVDHVDVLLHTRCK
jgi:origin recognition complex subunit 2